MAERFDLILVGGGLQNGLIALGALHVDPRRRIALIEASPTIGGNHTWCAHPGDVPAAARPWVDPLFDHRWPSYTVEFPQHRRRLIGEYAAITSDRFAQKVTRAFEDREGCTLYLGRSAATIAAHTVTLDDGLELTADLVIDARGPLPSESAQDCGFQKFIGLELELEQPHGLEAPILMDATVVQRDGFRFIYSLPFGPKRILIEDTAFARDPSLDREATQREILDYATRFGRVERIEREEAGVLPMPWASEVAELQGSPLLGGYRGGWFHPATGYSFPPAVRLAHHISQRRGREVIDSALIAMQRAHRTEVRFAQRLNRLLFHCFEPEDAWNVFARFYTLPDDVIRRFYALAMTTTDRGRLIVGRPPRGFSFRKALTMLRSA